MNTSINIKIDEVKKKEYTKKAKKLNVTLSEYVRLMLDGKITVNTKNPLLGLVGTLSYQEAEDMDNLIKNSRRNKKM
jgi:antitoxin component of RelBE/YafQ-DinJ toxin-antitoxin module